MSTLLTQSITLNNLPLSNDELKKTDRKTTEEVVNPKRAKALSLVAALQIGKTLLGAAKDISSTMRSPAGGQLDLSVAGERAADIAEPSDDLRANAEPTEPVADSEADSVEDDSRSDSDTDADTEGEMDDSDRGGDGQPRGDQSSKQQGNEPDAHGLVIDGGHPRRRGPRDDEQMLPPGAGKMLVEDLEAAYKKVEVTLRQVGGMAMNLPVKMDQLTHAPELMLMQLNMELSQIIDQALYSQLADQKSRNAMIADHQTMMDALRVEKGSIGDTENFDWEKHNPDIALHPESPARPSSAAEYAALMNQSYMKYLPLGYVAVGVSGREVSPGVAFLYLQVTRTVNGEVKREEWGMNVRRMEENYPGIGKLAIDYVRADEKAKGGNPGSMKLMDCLKVYGIVAEGKEPKNGGEVDAYIQKIKGVVDKLSSSQQLDMVRLQKMTNSRNEAFSMISNVNKQALDNRMAIVNNLR